MSRREAKDPRSEEQELPSVEIGTLKRILHQSSPTPQTHFHRRLREPGGVEWFEANLRAIIAEFGAAGTLLDNMKNRELLESIKRRGKKQLSAARSVEEVEDSALLYFSAVFGLLSNPETSSIDEVTGLAPAIVEDSVQVISEVLGVEYRPAVVSAERFFE